MVTIKPSYSTKQINNALKKGGEFVFESGEYVLTECLVLHSNTDVVCGEDVSFIRAHKGRMLQLYVTPDTKGYNGTHDVSWRKGKFFAGTRNENANVISLFHGKNIAFRSVAIVGCRGMHSIEVNACAGVALSDCIIRDQTSKGKECHKKCSFLCQQLWDYADPDEGMDEELFQDSLRDFCRAFVCPDCDYWDSACGCCDDDLEYCIDKAYKLLQTYKLCQTRRDWCGVDWGLVPRTAEERKQVTECTKVL